MIRDQFVEGCVSSRLRDRLCVEDQLTLQRLESIALAEDRAVDRQRLFGEGGGASRRDHPASPVSPPVEPTTSRLQAFGGSRLAVAGVIAVTVETEDGRSCQSSLYVADGSTALLGRDLQRSLHISVKDGSVVCAVADAAPSRDEQPQQRIDSQPEQQAAGETAADGRQTERGHAETNSELPQPEQPAAPDADQPLSPTLRTRYGRETGDKTNICPAAFR
ncbi:hypothetical protein FJT64_007111 [Amphibalanus amphitrite]|uniref:Uncharacterized protein n=1 Tax=Amphibalanus amphitrite TaxID=1232801 RepID=A0A6A4VZL9_AMPAM|nr:hypothetical protein FJT64_007111 [Amphibalanus amphitrite]